MFKHIVLSLSLVGLVSGSVDTNIDAKLNIKNSIQTLSNSFSDDMKYHELLLQIGLITTAAGIILPYCSILDSFTKPWNWNNDSSSAFYIKTEDKLALYESAEKSIKHSMTIGLVAFLCGAVVSCYRAYQYQKAKTRAAALATISDALEEKVTA